MSDADKVSPAEQAERIAVLTKLLAIYPKCDDPEMTLTAYLDLLQDVPLLWLRRGLYVLVHEPNRKFLPAVGEIRHVVAKEIRAAWRKKLGRSPDAWSPQGEPQVDVERWIKLAREPHLYELPAGNDQRELKPAQAPQSALKPLGTIRLDDYVPPSQQEEIPF